jgi:hypothetical protein
VSGRRGSLVRESRFTFSSDFTPHQPYRKSDPTKLPEGAGFGLYELQLLDKVKRREQTVPVPTSTVIRSSRRFDGAAVRPSGSIDILLILPL